MCKVRHLSRKLIRLFKCPDPAVCANVHTDLETVLTLLCMCTKSRIELCINKACCFLMLCAFLFCMSLDDYGVSIDTFNIPLILKAGV
jgi:hypothetical protein